MTVHELAPDPRADRCPRCLIRYDDLPDGDALAEDPDIITCTGIED